MRGFKGDVFKFSRVFILKLCFVLCLAIVSVLFYTHNVFADQFSWIGDAQPEVAFSTKVNNPSVSCTTTEKTIVGLNETRNVCIQSGGNFNFATFNYTGSIYKGAVSFGADRNMYFISNGMCGGYYNDCQYIPEQDMMINRVHYTATRTKFEIFKDFSKKLVQTKDAFDRITGYTFPFSTTQPDLSVPNIDTKAYSVSENGRWIVAELKNQGIISISTDNFNIKKFTNQYHQYDVGINPGMEFSITNDGSWIAVSGSNVNPNIYSVDDSCGLSVDPDDDMTEKSYTECPSKFIPDMIGDRANGLRYISEPKFSDDGGELQLYIGYYDRTKNETINLRAPGYTAPSLDYLALGDSYSSGEGDTEVTSSGQKHYLAFTDVNGDYANGIPREKCHQSWRAWPFLLADHYQMPEGKFEAVACSGAQIADISGVGKYEGQARGGSPNGSMARLEGLSNTAQLQSEAFEEFNPGRLRQLNFVNKYKPEAITIGIGGNDAGFGAKINSCVNPGSSQTTCEWANTKKSNLGIQIKNQFDKLVYLYNKLKNASSTETKIYAIGYPQFITDMEPAACGWNVGAANKEEREMIVQATGYMNKVIEAAASRAGVQYINIDNALNGGKLCEEGQEFVTGIANYGSQESYHPNSHGNWKILQKIKHFFGNNNLQNYPTYPSNGDLNITAPTTAYFAEAMANAEIKNTQDVQMSNGVVSKNTQHSQKINSYILKPNSTVARQLHSDPINLGDVVVNEDGSLDASFNIPNNTPVGYHTLIVKGESYSGEPIELTQTILVTGDDPNDLDENNIPDEDQPCGAFLDISSKDEDLDGVDDACDPIIDEVKPYRVRNGEISRSESIDNIYIERNVQATSLTGITGDSDPDGDGWAIVAQSTKSANSGVPAYFWIDDSKVPHVTIRTNDRGCVQFTPRSLKLVKLNKVRKLKLEYKNTNTCRSEPANSDVDNDGTVDNQQTLYRAHNGNSTNGEDPSSIYLERSSIAAEAQLGISDYPHSSSWNLLASSQDDTTKANFVKLVMVTDENVKPLPIILANQTKTSNKGKVTITCIALQPQNTSVIGINNLDRKLKKVAIPQGGNCD